MTILLVCLVVALGALYALQRKLIYFPSRMSRADFDATVRESPDGLVSVLAPFDAVVVEPPPWIPASGTAILFHGNAGLALDRVHLAPTFTGRGLRLVLAEYPGYGVRGGTATEDSVVGDAMALYSEVLVAYPNSPIMLVGESLGAGVAVRIAAQMPMHPPSRVVLLMPFLSLAETAARVYPLLPVRYLVRDRFDSARRLPCYKGPVAILVAGRDEVVGAAQGRALAKLSRSRGETVYVELPEAGHNSWAALITDEQWSELLGIPPVCGDPAAGPASGLQTRAPGG
jgi:alpha-beta hydrolase superfamily lysophospholipase